VVSVDSDVIVVGGGPAGCFSALHAARLGARVTVFEEHGTIGTPVHCTGHVSLAGLERLRLDLPREIFENEIRAASFYSPSGYAFSVRFPSPVTSVINRQLFDQHIAHQATLEGVEIVHDAHVDSFLVEEGSIKGVALRRGQKMGESTSRIVIDAEGVSAALLRSAGFPSLNHRFIVKGVQAEVDHVDGGEDGAVEVFLSKTYAPGFFAWIVPKRDRTAKVGLATAQGDPCEYLHRLVRHHPIVSQRIGRSRIAHTAYHPISLGGPIHRTVYDGLLIVGDAASHIKPTTGGGIVMGLSCARTAGQTAAHAIHDEDYSASFLSDYERRWRREVGFDMAAMKRLRLLFDGLTERQLDRLIASSSRLGLDTSLRALRDIDFQGASLIRMLKSPRFLAAALYLLMTSFL
jgi:digeranylgeranylglycerophospholipid reductase